jgi:hypothetical protein
MTLVLLDRVLEQIGLPILGLRLVRHDVRTVAASRRGGLPSLGSFASFQTETPSPFDNASIACHVLPGPVLADGDISAHLVGATAILDRFPWDGSRRPRIDDPILVNAELRDAGLTAYDLEWLDHLAPHTVTGS